MRVKTTFGRDREPEHPTGRLSSWRSDAQMVHASASLTSIEKAVTGRSSCRRSGANGRGYRRAPCHLANIVGTGSAETFGRIRVPVAIPPLPNAHRRSRSHAAHREPCRESTHQSSYRATVGRDKALESTIVSEHTTAAQPSPKSIASQPKWCGPEHPVMRLS
jgi:hypothetical protein